MQPTECWICNGRGNGGRNQLVGDWAGQRCHLKVAFVGRGDKSKCQSRIVPAGKEVNLVGELRIVAV